MDVYDELISGLIRGHEICCDALYDLRVSKADLTRDIELAEVRRARDVVEELSLKEGNIQNEIVRLKFLREGFKKMLDQ